MRQRAAHVPPLQVPPPATHHPTTRELDQVTWSLAYPSRSLDWNGGVTVTHADALMVTARSCSRWRADAEVRPYKKQVVTARLLVRNNGRRMRLHYKYRPAIPSTLQCAHRATRQLRVLLT